MLYSTSHFLLILLTITSVVTIDYKPITKLSHVNGYDCVDSLLEAKDKRGGDPESFFISTWKLTLGDKCADVDGKPDLKELAKNFKTEGIAVTDGLGNGYKINYQLASGSNEPDPIVEGNSIRYDGKSTFVKD